MRAMRLASTNRRKAVWLLLCTGLVGIFAFESSSPVAPQVIVALPPAPLPEPPIFDPRPRDAFAVIAARPLFSESRRPFVAASKADGGPSARIIAIELIGTLLMEQERAALLQPQGQKAHWLHAGETIIGWRVETIERNQVAVRRDNEFSTVQLRADLFTPAQSSEKPEHYNVQQRAERDDLDEGLDPEQEP